MQFPSAELDLIEPNQLIDAILNEDHSVIEQHFRKGRVATPRRALWAPTANDAPTEELQVILGHWSDIGGSTALPCAADFDPTAVRKALGYVILLDVLDGGADFYYRVFGTWIAQGVGYDMTGKLLSSASGTPALIEYCKASYRAVLRQRQPLLTYHYPPPDNLVRCWVRLILPLLNGNGEVSRLLVGNMPAPDGEISPQ